MKILVCNAGSTSLKFKLFDMPEERVLAEGRVERVGTERAIFHFSAPNGGAFSQEGLCVPTYTEGVQLFLDRILAPDAGVLGSLDELERVGFKCVLSKGHYGVHELDDEVLHGMEDSMVVAPAHNRPYLEVIHVFQTLVPEALLVGAFETAFHQTVPEYRRVYGIPYEWTRDLGIRRMGYHGASHGFVAETLARRYGSTGRTISCHLGGSCSICAIDDGKSVDTSFGLSLQAGPIQSSRCGDVDPFVIPFLLESGMTLSEVERGLTTRGGLLGISGVSSDLRDVSEAARAGNGRAQLAIKVFVNDIVRYIGAYYAELGGLDHLVFTGGIGEHSAEVRGQVCTAVRHLGVLLEDDRNAACNGVEAVISEDDSPVVVTVLPANEELGVARKTFAFKRD